MDLHILSSSLKPDHTAWSGPWRTAEQRAWRGLARHCLGPADLISVLARMPQACLQPYGGTFNLYHFNTDLLHGKKFKDLSVYSWWESLWGRLCKQDALLLKIIPPNKKWICYYLSEWSLFTRLTAYLIKMPSSVPEWNSLETVSELLPSLLKAFWTLLKSFQYRISHPNVFFEDHQPFYLFSLK